MDIRQLRYLVALARERHFARAAGACCVSQPTLSAGIRALEDELGVPIVERGNRFLGFTAEGGRVLERARRILEECSSLDQELSGLRGRLEGRLAMGVIPSVLPVISRITLPFFERHPGVTISVRSLSSKEILRQLESFELHLGVTYLDNEPLGGVRCQPLFIERYALVVSTGHPLAERASLSWKEAALLPLCLLTPDMQNRRIVDSMFAQVGVPARAVIETNSIAALQAHVREGPLATILPDNHLDNARDSTRLCAIPLIDPEASQSVGLIIANRDPPSPLAQAMWDVATLVSAPG